MEAVEVQKLLDQIRSIDLDGLSRRTSLGEDFSFEDAVKPASEVISFYNKIPPDYINDLPDHYLQRINDQALSFLNVVRQIGDFKPGKEDNPSLTRQNIISSLRGMYITAFDQLHPIVSYLASRQRDFSELAADARMATESAKRQAQQLSEQMLASREEAENALSEIRKVAAEQGVSQQATYFREEADRHEGLADKWEIYTVRTAIGLGSYSALVLLFSLMLDPKSQYQAFQIALSKILIFAVIAYMLFHCARTLMAHRHNAVVNRHRQNALLTFNALVEASRSEDKRDIVLTHAAGCIFLPQETGYSKSSQIPQLSSAQLIEALPRLAHGS